MAIGFLTARMELSGLRIHTIRSPKRSRHDLHPNGTPYISGHHTEGAMTGVGLYKILQEWWLRPLIPRPK